MLTPMKTLRSHHGLSRPVAGLLGAGLITLTLLISGCATAVKVESSPPGASVTIGGKTLSGKTPTEYQVENANKPVEVSFTLEGHFPKNFTYLAGSSPQAIFARLEPTQLRKSFEVTSEPAGASVTLEGQPVGTTPVTVPVVFTRSSESAPWTPQRLAIAKTDYQSEPVVLTSDLSAVPVQNLGLLKDERIYNITAATPEGAALNAVVTLDGVQKGKTPMKLPITYTRADKTKPWPKFNVTLEIPGQYKPATTELNYTRDTTVALKLIAITEIPVHIFAPMVRVTPTGAAFVIVERTTIGTLRTSDDSSAVTDLKQVTTYDRQDRKDQNRIETINSFTVTPDGQNVIFSLTETDGEGNRYSALKIKRSDDAGGGISTLTPGTRNFDTQPFMVRDQNNYLVFASNRGDRSKADVYRVNLVEGKMVGGFSRLTSDNRFNFAPTYGDSNRQLFYLSIEPGYPKAESQLSSIRFDGSLPTQLQVVAEQINNTNPEKILFVKLDPETKKLQIYSITADGKLETPLVNDESYRKANCFNPYISADGQRVLFASDRTSGGREERANNNIYIVNADGSNLQQLTNNESDDTMPQWSPSEEGVIYFLSTRGGATNIWRFKLVTGR